MNIKKCVFDVKASLHLHVVVWCQNYIARFGHGSAKLARQAKSKEKTLRRMVEGGLTARVSADKVLALLS